MRKISILTLIVAGILSTYTMHAVNLFTTLLAMSH